jgi:hypothetical protein
LDSVAVDIAPNVLKVLIGVGLARNGAGKCPNVVVWLKEFPGIILGSE